jgi:hypothetical protein
MNAHRLEITASLLATVWSVVGLLVGIVVGAWLAHSGWHKDQHLESKKAKYRELGREDWEKLRNVLAKIALQDLVILGETSPPISGGQDPHPN